MPPKLKFTKSEITTAALNLVRREGFTRLSARNLGIELGTSSRPIFTAFKNMEDLQQKTINHTKLKEKPSKNNFISSLVKDTTKNNKSH